MNETSLNSKPSNIISEQVPKKPKSVLLVQILASVFLLAFLMGIVRMSIRMINHESLAQFGMSVIVRFGVQLAIIFILVVLLISLHKRSKIGRILGLVFIGATMLPEIMPMIFINPSAISERYEFVYFATILVFLLPLAYWMYSFFFSVNSRQYFKLCPAEREINIEV
ncbi:hypothetical protein [Solimicrobium silvestre]|uniref:Uncharacterized protein n=1 Tax=Solimicrobium silvestre TaxID=2099400 RepID=A0A2S9GT32_9BURK|nr:hypothetical protein [Solimicrobium silvestre]PRC90877.1 hypothetical protein S2091_4370 [Solimicrobium silvestre]